MARWQDIGVNEDRRRRVAAGFRRAMLARPVIGQTAANRVAVPYGWALLKADDNDSLAIITELADGAPRVTQGYGGWEEVDRRGRAAITSWSGFAPIGIELDLFLDDFDAGRSVEGAIEVLEALAGRGKRATGGEPPQVIVDTSGVMPHDFTASPDQRWVVNDLEWGDDDTIINDRGNRVRASVTVTLLQHVKDQRLEDRALAAAKRLQSRQGGSRRVYTAVEGDTLMSIARKKLGDAGRYTELGRLNDIRDPRSIRAGARIKLP